VNPAWFERTSVPFEIDQESESEKCESLNDHHEDKRQKFVLKGPEIACRKWTKKQKTKSD
jgi:hypothetical protein